MSKSLTYAPGGWHDRALREHAAQNGMVPVQATADRQLSAAAEARFAKIESEMRCNALERNIAALKVDIEKQQEANAARFSSSQYIEEMIAAGVDRAKAAQMARAHELEQTL